jgi:hypothetical protein
LSHPVALHSKTSILLGLLFFLALSVTTQAQVPLNKISTDPFTNPDSQHATEVEADTFSAGNTIVTAFQQGRFETGGGCSDIGWATSLDGGQTWQHGSLPGLTSIEGSGPFDRVSDPAVAFDAAHGVWMIGVLPLSESGSSLPPMAVNRSIDGINWSDPVMLSGTLVKPDKTWLACDNNSDSPFFGHCYAAYDDNGIGDVIFMSTSTDGGLTWSRPVQPRGGPIGLGGQPMARPNGVVVVTSSDAFLSSEIAWGSKDGGKTWQSTGVIAFPVTHGIAGGLRDLNLPSAAMDSTGRTFVAFHDCSFRAGCSANDIVISASRDGRTWSPIHRVPIDAVNSGVDHFIPGLEIEPGTGGSSAHLAITYYFYPQANCTTSTCQLMEGYITSPDSGHTWTAPVTLAGPIKLSWLASTDQGFMVGDYQSLSFAGGLAFPAIASAKAKSGSTFNEAMFSPVTGLTDGLALYTSDNDKPVPNAHSDHPPRTTPARGR